MDSTEAVVYTAAIHSDNPEFAKAKEKNLTYAYTRTAPWADYEKL